MSPFPGSCVKVSLDEARRVIAETVPNRRIRTIIWHHFWRPKASQWKGVKTVRSVRRHHVRKRGWRDIAYNWIFGPDGSIVTGRSLMITGGHTIGRNKDSVGLALCLDGAAELLADFAQMEAAILAVSAELCNIHGLDEHDLHFHREYARKSSGCPGWLLDLEDYRDLLGPLVSPVGSELLWVRLRIAGAGPYIEGLPLVNRDGHVQFERDCPVVLPDVDAGGLRGEWIRNWLEAHGYVIQAWRPREGPAGTIYAYKRGD